MMCKTIFKKSGFTLIEIIITVFIGALLGAMIITFLSKSLVDSSEPVRRLRQTSDLNAIMANITADYNRYPKWRSGTVYSNNSFVIPTIRNGRCYTTAGGGTSGSIEPNWPPTGMDGNITWIDGGPLPFLNTLQMNINNKIYGTYDIVYNNFVQFPLGSDAETAGGNTILKVTIGNTQGETLTALFLKGQNE